MTMHAILHSTLRKRRFVILDCYVEIRNLPDRISRNISDWRLADTRKLLPTSSGCARIRYIK